MGLLSLHTANQQACGGRADGTSRSAMQPAVLLPRGEKERVVWPLSPLNLGEDTKGRHEVAGRDDDRGNNRPTLPSSPFHNDTHTFTQSTATTTMPKTPFALKTLRVAVQSIVSVLPLSIVLQSLFSSSPNAFLLLYWAAHLLVG